MPTKEDTNPEPLHETGIEKKKFKLSPEVIGLLGVIATIVAGLIASPLIEKLGSNAATPTMTAETPTFQVTDTPTVIAQGFTPVVSPGDAVDAKGVVMAFVPAGKFTMGGNNGYNDEKPPHDVYLDAYYIDKYEVTNSMYKICVDTGTCQLPSDIRHYDDPQYANHPVVYVDWQMAQTYCEWRGTRLPTEAEWEKAARGIDNRIYPWGDVASCEQANYGNCISDTTQVGKYPSGASPYGVYDMAGNVWEWVADWYLSDYYQILDQNVSNPQGPSSGDQRVIRGGGWSNKSNSIRTSYRSYFSSSDNDVGFRCARSENVPVTATVAVTLTANAAELNLPSDIVDDKRVAMVLVPAGKFTMGTDNEDADSNAQPAHTVYLDAFYIDKYEVTNILYQACVDAKVCDPPVYTGSSTRDNYYGNTLYDNYPVANVNWFMADAYCEWRGARLPTEAEWEKAARGDDQRNYPWGNEDIDKSFTNYNLYIGDTTAVGSYEKDKSFYGVYDMAGNVFEWLADWYSDGYYKASPAENPLGPELGKYRAVRGGSWYSAAKYSLAYNRGSKEPDKSFNNFGFRCAEDANP